VFDPARVWCCLPDWVQVWVSSLSTVVLQPDPFMEANLYRTIWALNSPAPVDSYAFTAFLPIYHIVEDVRFDTEGVPIPGYSFDPVTWLIFFTYIAAGPDCSEGCFMTNPPFTVPG